MKKIFKLLTLVSMGLIMNSCYYDAYPEYEEIDNGKPGEEPEVFFATDIEDGIFVGFCDNCHKGAQNPDLRKGNAYNSLVPAYVTADDADGSPLYIKLNGGHNGVTDAEVALIKEWINQGAKDN